MKITGIHIYGIKLPLQKPFVITYETYTDMPTIIVKVKTNTGFEGYGEATPDQHVTGETWESTISVLKEQLAPAIIGMSPFDIEAVHERMNTAISRVPAAKAAIDMACYDLMGKGCGQPVFRLIGGKTREQLRIPYVLSILTAKEMASETKKAVADGYSIIKIKVGLDWVEDIRRINAVREAAGPSVRLRVDANQGWKTSENTLRVLKEVRKADIDWIEQPAAMHDIETHVSIKGHSTVPVMIDEGLHDSNDLLQIIRQRAADLINIKLMKCGGIFPAIKLAHQAEMAGIRCQIGSMVESSVASAAGAHLASAKRNIQSNEMVGPLMFSKDISELNYEDGLLKMPDSPGLGVEVDANILRELCLKEEYIS
jgi:L-Ala-D/L-Glu epimerase